MLECCSLYGRIEVRQQGGVRLGAEARREDPGYNSKSLHDAVICSCSCCVCQETLKVF